MCALLMVLTSVVNVGLCPRIIADCHALSTALMT